ncbi:acetylornithine transaminase [Candidatus Puniceispirillum sp.]|uniref:aspartate aminotransferase family protein n=1 Tax=Candidatus Puniceispirillum sp. TaxID=2026719 RepID=UPI001EBD1B41|nr:acetylornithine transaminase [Candidatus Puniceispirillum sp.]MBT6566070.1 acetylornithine transaminase [Candidatus Puniceispirillum sp.]
MTNYADNSAVMKTYGRTEIAFVRGDGCWLESDDGIRYLDCASGIAVNTLGHAHPGLVAALQAQAATLWHTSNLYRIPGQERVAKKLASLSGLDQVFFCNSGAEATEASVKIARRAAHEAGMPERMTILCASGAFHGRTLGMLAATDRPAFRTGFGPMPAGFEHVSFGNMNSLRAAMGPHVAAIMIEAVQGEGGAKQVPSDYMAEARAAANEFGALIIADEVQAGIGRTGHMFSFQESGIKPDIIALAKGLAGGFPVGAVIASEKVGNAMTPGTHGSTFGGNPLAMAAADVVLDELSKPGFLADVQRRAALLDKGLRELQNAYPQMIEELRGRGFLRGIKCADDCNVATIMAGLRAQHVLAVPAAENTLRLLPPLIISEDEIDIVLGALAHVFETNKTVDAKGQTS